MKKPVLSIVSALLLGMQANAQTIPNSGFETWVASAPQGWSGFDTVSVSRSTDKNGGSYSVKVIPINFGGFSLPGLISMENMATTAKSNYLNGYIKASLVTGDTIEIGAAYESGGGSTVGGGVDNTSTSRSTWTPFHVTLAFPTSFTPDSFTVYASISGSDSSWMLLDDLSLSNTPIGSELGTGVFTGTQNTTDPLRIISSIYPNPVCNNAAIAFSLPTASEVTVRVYDVAGREVKTITKECGSAGARQLSLNVDELGNGIYLYTIQAGGMNETRKFVVNK